MRSGPSSPTNAACARHHHVYLTVETGTSGRPVLNGLDNKRLRQILAPCGDSPEVPLTKTDRDANAKLLGLINSCQTNSTRQSTGAGRLLRRTGLVPATSSSAPFHDRPRRAGRTASA